LNIQSDTNNTAGHEADAGIEEYVGKHNDAWVDVEGLRFITGKIKDCLDRIWSARDNPNHIDIATMMQYADKYLQKAGGDKVDMPEFDRCAEALIAVGEIKKAANLAEKFKSYVFAAQLYEQCDCLAQAAELYELADDFHSAAVALEKLKNNYRAGCLFEKSPKTLLKSAELFSNTLVARQESKITTRYAVLDIAVSADGKAALGFENGTIMLLGSDGELEWKLRLPEGIPASTLSISDQGQRILVGSEKGRYFLYDGEKNLLKEEKLPFAVHSVSINASGECYVVGGDDGSIKFYDAVKGKLLWQHRVSFTVWSVKVDRQGLKVAAGSGDQCLYIFDKNGKEINVKHFPEWVHSVDWDRNGDLLAVAYGRDNLELLSNDGGETVFNENLNMSIHDLRFAADDDYLAVAAHDLGFVFNTDGTMLWSKAFEDKVFRIVPTGGKRLIVGFQKEDASRYSLKNLLRRAALNYERCDCMDEAANIYEGLGEYQEAYKFFIQSNNTEGQARTLVKLDRKAEAVEKYLQIGFKEQAAELSEELGEYETAIALYQQLGINSKAAALSERVGDDKAAASRYRDSGEFQKAARIFDKIGMNKDALECYRNHLAHSPDDWPQVMCFADTLMANADYREAIQVLQRLVMKEEYKQESLLRLARCFSHERLYDIAISRYEDYLGKDEGVTAENKEPYYELALLYETIANYQRTQQIFKDILAADFEFKDVKERLENIKDLQSVYTSSAPPGSGGQTVVHQELSPEFKTRYQVVKKLGEGGMGTVFMANDTRLGRCVALKVIRPQFAAEERFKVRFLREARSAAAVQHPNIVQVYDAGADGDNQYIAMEYIEGRSLRDILDERAFTIEEVLPISMQVCDALACAHRNGIVHRDIKPDNIMLTGNPPQVKVMDFGLARVEQATFVTAEGAVLGSWLYMSPEQASGGTVDARSDIYSLGITLYEILTGKAPFTDGDITFHHVHTPPKPPVETREDIPQALNDLILECLAKKPDDRPKTAAKLGEQFLQIQREVGGS